MLDRIQLIERTPYVLRVELQGERIGEIHRTTLGVIAWGHDSDTGNLRRLGAYSEQEGAIAAVIEFLERAP